MFSMSYVHSASLLVMKCNVNRYIIFLSIRMNPYHHDHHHHHLSYRHYHDDRHDY